jgi:hypothetical protein
LLVVIQRTEKVAKQLLMHRIGIAHTKIHRVITTSSREKAIR